MHIPFRCPAGKLRMYVRIMVDEFGILRYDLMFLSPSFPLGSQTVSCGKFKTIFSPTDGFVRQRPQA